MPTMITAHSGCDDTPDNSLEFVHHALACGADAFEVDIHSRNTGALYLSHDPTEDERPALETVFSLLRESSMQINCDLKEFGLEQRVLELATQYGVAERVLLSGSVSAEAIAQSESVRTRTLWNIESACPELLAQCHQGIVPSLEVVWAAAQVLRRQGISIINIHYSVCTADYLDIFREAGIQVSAWTVNDAPSARRLLDAGVYNLTTRKPGLLLALRDKS